MMWKQFPIKKKGEHITSCESPTVMHEGYFKES